MTNAVTVAKPTDIMSYNVPAGLNVVRQVTRTILKQEDQVPLYVEFETAAREGMPIKAADPKKAMPPARIADVINLETGELQLLIMNTVLESELDRAYGVGGYGDKRLGVLPNKPGTGNGVDRRYALYRIVEVDYDREANQIEATGKPAIDATTQAAVDRTKGKK